MIIYTTYIYIYIYIIYILYVCMYVSIYICILTCCGDYIRHGLKYSYHFSDVT